jgi:hypothetical protein
VVPEVPVLPVDPVVPVLPVDPVEPDDPLGPVKPLEPEEPVSSRLALVLFELLVELEAIATQPPSSAKRIRTAITRRIATPPY